MIIVSFYRTDFINYLAIYQGSALTVSNILTGETVSVDFVSEVRQIGMFSRSPDELIIGCLEDFKLIQFKLARYQLIPHHETVLSDSALSCVSQGRRWCILLSTGIVVTGEHDLLPLSTKYVRPVSLQCSDYPVKSSQTSTVLVLSGYLCYSVLGGNFSFRLDSPLLAFASFSEAPSTSLDAGLLLVSRLNVSYLEKGGKVSYNRSFEEKAENAYVFSEDTQNIHRSIVLFPKTVAILRGPDTVWVFPRDSLGFPLMRELFVTSDGHLLSISTDGKFAKDSLDLAWKQSNSVSKRKTKDMTTLSGPLRDESARKISQIKTAPILTGMQQTPASQMDQTSINILRDPVARVAFVAAQILSIGDKELSQGLAEIFSKSINTLQIFIPS